MRTSLRQWLRIIMIPLCLMLFAYFFFAPSQDISPPDKTQIAAQFFKQPIYFERNEGQINTSVNYLTRGTGYTFYFTPQEVVMVLQNQATSSSVLKIQFMQANPYPLIKGLEEQACKSNYFIGHDPEKWHTNVSNYTKIQYQDLYPGINAIFYGHEQQLEYDLCVAPGGNPQDARLHIEGAQTLLVDENGHLRIVMDNAHEVLMQKPFVYQVLNGNQVAIEGKYVLLAQNEIGFALGTYDIHQTLVIDPVLVYSTYLGGIDFDSGNAIAVDSNGNAYVTGDTLSLDFPITGGAYQPTLTGSVDVFITKFNPTGSALIYSTYLGGSSVDHASAIALDSSGNAYITGDTNSADFPTTPGAFQTIFGFGAKDAFVTKLNATGSALVYSTFLGGNDLDFGYGIAVDSSGNAYITGQTSSNNFPTTVGAFQTALNGSSDAFVTKFNSTGSAPLVYSTYLGGSNGNKGNAIAIDSSGNAYITGQTSSNNFPTTAGAFQTAQPSNINSAFVTKLTPVSLAPLIYSTYLGGSGNSSANGTSIAVDSNGNAYVTGTTFFDFPITSGAFQTVFSGNGDAFVTKFNATGSTLIYSTYLGGSDVVSGSSIALDNNGNAYITGMTTSIDFPVTPTAFQPTLKGATDAFITKFNATGSALVYSTYLGGTINNIGHAIAVDSNGNAYITGETISNDFPTTLGAFQMVYGGNDDGFVTKFAIGTPTINSITPISGTGNGGTPVTITGTNFSNATAVFFGAIPATFIIDNDNQITAFAPSQTGTVSVTVIAPGGTSSITPADSFTYTQEPTMLTFFVSPNPVVAGQSLTLTAIVTPADATGTVTFLDQITTTTVASFNRIPMRKTGPFTETVVLGIVPLINGTATLVISSLTPGSHSLSAVYNGDNGHLPTTSPITINLIVTPSETPVPPVPPVPPGPFILPPNHLKGFQVANRFVVQTEYVNILTWRANSQRNSAVAYRIYRDSLLKQLIGVISGSHDLRFEDHNREKGKTYTYFVVSVDEFGNTSLPATVTIKGHSS